MKKRKDLHKMSRKITRSSTKTIEFVAWDGEGVNGQYILLRNSTGRAISNRSGLSTLECLEFLLQSSSRMSKTTKHVIFGGGYDVNMLLRDCDRETLWSLWTTGTCEYQGYRLSYLPRKSFTISRMVTKNDRREINGRDHVSTRTSHNSTITLWDVWGFFQSTFVGAMHQYIPDYDPVIYANIVEHKKQRSDFRVEDMDEIADYCKLEVDALKEIMNRVKNAMDTAGVSVKRWDGAGAVAEGLLRKYRVKEHMANFTETEPEMHAEAWRAYAGGRIELCRYGRYSGAVWHGDINSAYPSIIRHLPSFARGSWIRVDSFTRGSYGLWHVRWCFSYSLSCPIFPFFFRDPNGTISYPIQGEGSYWSPEVEAAFDCMGEEGIEVLGGWVWTQDTSVTSVLQDGFSQDRASTVRPFQFVEEVYQQRKMFKQQKNAAQMILKLGMNSLYGKLAQQIGYNKNEKPAYQQIEWAGWITSATRASLYRVAMQHPHDVISFCTDGLFSTKVHRVNEGTELGQWEINTHDEIVAAQSGVYWYRDGEKWIEKYRGFDTGVLTWEMVITAYANLAWTVQAKCTRFIGVGGALQSPAMWKNWRTFYESSRQLLLISHGTKRIDVQPFWTKEMNPSVQLFATLPKINEWALLGVRSGLYKKHSRVTLTRQLEREEQDAYI